MENSENNVLDANFAREESINRCIQALIHATSCNDKNCTLPKCSRLKQILQHIRGCKKRQEFQCLICKQFISLCVFHAKKCTDRQCKVTFCERIRAKIEELLHQQNEQEIEETLLRQFELLVTEE